MTGFNPWTDEEIARLRVVYAVTFREDLQLASLAKELGRHKSNVSRKARALGLTNQSRPGVKQPRLLLGRRTVDDAALRRLMSENSIRWHATHPHPRGALGMTHTAKTRVSLVAASRRLWATMTPDKLAARRVKRHATNVARYGVPNPAFKTFGERVYSNAKWGRRADLNNQFFRSRWEANYARHLQWLLSRDEIREWHYEPETFVFPGVTRGGLTYTPDFLVIDGDGSRAFHEVKGWMDDKSKAKLHRMAEFYPEVVVLVIGPEEYRAIALVSGLLPGWEKERESGGRTDRHSVSDPS